MCARPGPSVPPRGWECTWSVPVGTMRAAPCRQSAPNASKGPTSLIVLQPHVRDARQVQPTATAAACLRIPAPFVQLASIAQVAPLCVPIVASVPIRIKQGRPSAYPAGLTDPR